MTSRWTFYPMTDRIMVAYTTPGSSWYVAGRN